jgi:hypothetical protein
MAMQPSTPNAGGPVIRRASARDTTALAADSDRDDVRELIRKAIRSGTIRVAPWPGNPDRVRLIPTPNEMTGG